MGLDMHLYRANLHGHSLRQACLVENYLDLQQWNAAHPDKTYSLMQWSHQDPNEIQPQALQDLEPEFKLGYSYFDTKKAWGLYRIFQECAYWRKANAIHNWFVQNVQNGVDDRDIYLVTREQLEQLKEACEMVLAQVQTKDAQVCVGTRYSNRKVSPIMEDGRVITNPEKCAEILPTQGGYFFGSPDYDEYYIQDVETTIKIITEVLEQTNWDVETIAYSSSW